MTVAGVADSDVFERFASPTWIDRDNIDFFRGFEQQLLINKCGACGKWSQPPYPVCPFCQSDDVHATPVSGRGKIFTFTILYTGSARGVDYSGGHPVAVIDLKEQDGLRATGTIVGCANDEIEIGMPVELTWIERRDAPIPAWQPSR